MWRGALVALLLAGLVGCSRRDVTPPRPDATGARRFLEAKPMGECASSGMQRIPRAARRDGIDVDLDGDQRPDRFTVWIDRSTGVPADAHIRVATATGTVIDREALSYAHTPVVVGATDVNDDGTLELWVGAPGWEAVWAATLADCRLVALEAHDPASLSRRGIDHSGGPEWFTMDVPSDATGVECVDVDGNGTRDVVEYSSSSRGSWNYLAWRIVGTRVEALMKRSGTDPAKRPANVTWRPGFRCDGLVYP